MNQSALQRTSWRSHDEAATYHDAAHDGHFALLVQHPDRKRQSSYPLHTMPTVLNELDPTRDTWLTQAEFIRPNRRLVNLKRIGLQFVDLDTYRVKALQGRKPECLAGTVTHFCDDEGIPQPSLMVYSGRGLQLKWLHEGTIPRQALPRWNACQRLLVDKLKVLGADPAAKDASRVLRLVDTVNSKSGEICRVVHVNEERGAPMRYNFERLCEELLPKTRQELEVDRKARETRRHLTRSLRQLWHLRGFSNQQLAWDRLEDIRFLIVIRGGAKEGERMLYLFWCLNFLLLSGATCSQQLFHEAAALAREIDPRWSYGSAELGTLYRKAKANEAGERIEFNGKKYSPLYTPTNDTLINLFEITDDEQRQLRTIISTDLARERHRKRDEERRRAAGAVDRETYETFSLSHHRPWEALGMSRRTWYRRGKPGF